MGRKFRFIYKNILRLTFGVMLSLLIPRDKKICIMSLNVLNEIDAFMHNSKYFFLYLSNEQTDLKAIWLCDDQQMLKEFRCRGYRNVYKRYSIRGIWYALRAKYWLYDISPMAISCFSKGATCINFWHGSGTGKKMGFDAIESSGVKKGSLQEKIYTIIKIKDNYSIVSSKAEGICRKSAFHLKDNQIILTGAPRLDVLYKDIKDSDMFMENDYNSIKHFKELGKKIFFYVPTFRDTNIDISNWLKSSKLKQFLIDNNAIFVCKLHYADVNSISNTLSENFYKMDNQSDIYPILKYSDCLITDYSSIFFDYYIIDKPIIFHIPDLQEYLVKCRGFYREYETLTAGVYTKTEDELLSAMQDVVYGIDNYKSERKKLRDEMFVYQDGNNCERVLKFIQSLNSKNKGEL